MQVKSMMHHDIVETRPDQIIRNPVKMEDVKVSGVDVHSHGIEWIATWTTAARDLTGWGFQLEYAQSTTSQVL
jgi:hypothetical protein